MQVSSRAQSPLRDPHFIQDDRARCVLPVAGKSAVILTGNIHNIELHFFKNVVRLAFPCEFHPHRSARAWIKSATATHTPGVATRKATAPTQRNLSRTRRHRAGRELPGSPQRNRLAQETGARAK